MSERYDGLQFDEVKQLITKYTSFSLGHQIIEQLQPSFNKLVVERENGRLKQAIGMVVSYGTMPFGGIYDVSQEVSLAMKDVSLSPLDLTRIASQAYGIAQIKKYISNCDGDKNLIKELSDSLTAFENTAATINKCISYSGDIHDNASSNLASIRRKTKNLQKSISSKLNEFISKNQAMLQDNIIAYRNGRSVILVKNTYKNSIEGLQYGSSSSKGATYIEPNAFIGLNNQLLQLIEDEKQEIARILFELSQLVKKDGAGYLANVNTLGLLDAIFAKAQWAKEVDATVGEISSVDLILKKARHPLIDPAKVVANDYRIISPVKTVLITGPNTGGKTVSLKVIGLFSVMFLSAMPLPAREAQIPVFDNIFYDIGDGQSINADLSSFSSHISNISSICKKVTTRSLVILDELGGSTDPNEGQAFASAVLEYFRRKNIYVVATTHFSKLKAYAKQHDNIMLSSVEFDQNNLKPTFKYIENSIGSSNAIETAKRFGINDEIIELAYEFKKQQSNVDDTLIEKLQQQLETVRQKQKQLLNQEQLLKQQYQQLNEEKEKLTIEKEIIIEKAKNEALNIVSDAKAQSEEIIEELKQQKTYQINEVAKLKHQLNQIVEVEQKEEILEGDIEVGDYVKVKLTNQKGKVISLDRKNVLIDANGIRIRTAISAVVKTGKPELKKLKAVKTKVNSARSFSIELNLIGLRVDEAVDTLDKYLDEALLANVPFVRVIHGYGTGALRNAVWDQLKKYKFVKTYEHGSATEGSSGTTIVYFKE
ncbi:MAG: endonuclease MutS2 [Erysipelotrichaceae bacterium]|jgi:DNA mismatch repair protein MutS2